MTMLNLGIFMQLMARIKTLGIRKISDFQQRLRLMRF